MIFNRNKIFIFLYIETCSSRLEFIKWEHFIILLENEYEKQKSNFLKFW